MHETLNIWRFTDGKRGHENQTRGLVDSLRRLMPVEEHTVELDEVRPNFFDWLFGRFSAQHTLPPPDLLLGAGRLTHWPMLVAKRATGAAAVVLMRPAPWFQSRFDLCLVPEHDAAIASNIVPTTGALTAIHPGGEHSATRGIILVGGPSSHHNWDGPGLVENVRAIVAGAPSVHWKLTPSRRTPLDTTSALLSLDQQNLEVWPVEKTGPHWVPDTLAASASAWVTEDSVSMVYEALTSGAATGILPVPRRRDASRVILGLNRLVGQNYAAFFDPDAPQSKPAPPKAPLDEATRCAKIVRDRLFPDHPSANSSVPPFARESE